MSYQKNKTKQNKKSTMAVLVELRRKFFNEENFLMTLIWIYFIFSFHNSYNDKNIVMAAMSHHRAALD